MALDDLMDPLDETVLSRADVEKRVDDWLSRLDNLLVDIRAWAGREGWTAESDAPVPMHEELMQRVGMPKRDQPALRLRNADGAELWIRPKALWVIGANGRVDLFSRHGAFILIDLAEPLQPPHWVLHVIGKGKGRPFSPPLLADLA